MKTALITTTINVPEVLRLYRKLDSDVRFFVAGDLNSPHEPISELCEQIGNSLYIHPEDQQQYKCSALVGWRNIQRRNIALLEALKWGATHIYSVDDDNSPIDRNHFANMRHGFNEFDGLQVSALGGWVDTGAFLIMPARQRGIPHDAVTDWDVKPVVAAKVGVVAGACLGDPDVSAVDRISKHPYVAGGHPLARAGFVIDPSVWTVFNSQNTAFVRDLAPCMFMLPHIGRYDDIFASLITQRVMHEHGYHVHFGKPFVWQSRNEHNLLTDLKAEIFGMERVDKLARCLDAITLPPGSPVIQFRKIVTFIDEMQIGDELLPKQTIEAMKAWADDVEQAMTELPL